jgi:CRP/FNR family transcriptional regulator, cyclic AMP receptor protein
MALSTQEKAAWLGRVQLFHGASPTSIDRLAEVTGEIDFPAGRHIVQQGMVGNGLYILVSGTARVVQGDDLLARLGPGDFFGELAVIDQMPRTASVVAEEPVTCLALASWDLIALLEQDPHLALNLLRELALRLRAADEQHRH